MTIGISVVFASHVPGVGDNTAEVRWVQLMPSGEVAYPTSHGRAALLDAARLNHISKRAESAL